MLTVQKLEWLQPFKNLNTKIDVKVLPATVKNWSGKVWTPWLAKFLYSKGVVAWMRSYSAAKREYIANMDYLLCFEKQRFDSFVWTAQNYWMTPCEQSTGSLWMQPKTNKKLPWVSNVTAACPKDVLEFKFFWEPSCIIVVYRLLWSPYTVHSSRAPSEGYI